MPEITIVSLSPSGMAGLSRDAAEEMTSGKKLVLRTEKHPAARELRKMAVNFVTLDSFYDRYDDFGEMYAAMARSLWATAALAPLIYAVPDYSLDGSVAVLDRMKPEGAVLKLIPSFSTADFLMGQLPPDCWASSGTTIISAMEAVMRPCRCEISLLILEIGNLQLACDLKLHLMEYYGDETETVLFHQGAAPRKLKLYELDREKQWDHNSALFIPAMKEKERTIFTLDDMSRLTAQTEKSENVDESLNEMKTALRKAVEEAAVLSAEEMGDKLAQVVSLCLRMNSLLTRCGNDGIDEEINRICRELTANM